MTKIISAEVLTLIEEMLKDPKAFFACQENEISNFIEDLEKLDLLNAAFEVPMLARLDENDESYIPLQIHGVGQLEPDPAYTARKVEIDDYNIERYPGNTVLIAAIKGGASLDFVRDLINKGALPSARTFATSPIREAIANGNIYIINELLEAGFVIDQSNSFELLSAALEAKQYDVFRYLSDRGADINSTNSAGKTLLMEAQEEEDIRVILSLGSRVNVHKKEVGSDKNTALHMAVIQENVKKINLLLGAGANIESERDELRDATPLALALANKVPNKEVVKCLLESGAKLNVLCIYSILERGDRDLTDMIIEYADFNLADKSGSNAFERLALLEIEQKKLKEFFDRAVKKTYPEFSKEDIEKKRLLCSAQHLLKLAYSKLGYGSKVWPLSKMIFDFDCIGKSDLSEKNRERLRSLLQKIKDDEIFKTQNQYSEISATKTQRFYLMRAGHYGHASGYVIQCDQDNNCQSLTYIDGNGVSELRDENKTFGAVKFKLNENWQDLEKLKVHLDKLSLPQYNSDTRTKFINDLSLLSSKTQEPEYMVETKAQKRPICPMKFLNLLLGVLMKELYGEELLKESTSPQDQLNIHEEVYNIRKEFKKGVINAALDYVVHIAKDDENQLLRQEALEIARGVEGHANGKFLVNLSFSLFSTVQDRSKEFAVKIVEKVQSIQLEGARQLTSSIKQQQH